MTQHLMVYRLYVKYFTIVLLNLDMRIRMGLVISDLWSCFSD